MAASRTWMTTRTAPKSRQTSRVIQKTRRVEIDILSFTGFRSILQPDVLGVEEYEPHGREMHPPDLGENGDAGTVREQGDRGHFLVQDFFDRPEQADPLFPTRPRLGLGEHTAQRPDSGGRGA